jgi:ABC-type lipoprotein export system ATPase subunit
VRAATVASASGVVKTFGEGRAAVRVLDGAEVELGRGELVVVVGRSGSGKSTLLHLLGGLDRADAGEIVVAGIDVARADEVGLNELRRRHVGFVFQAFHLLPELTGLENVLLPARLAGDGSRSRARARETLRQLGVDEAASRLPTTMSGGEQQRVAIARALVNDPSLVLADEPTGNLDAESASAVLTLLREIADGGRCVLLATHEVAAAGIADRVLRLHAGKLHV